MFSSCFNPRRSGIRATMASLLSKAKAKLPGQEKETDKSASSSTSNSSSPTRKSRKSSNADRVIPPEPVQQQTHGDFSQHDAERPLQLHNLARASRRCKKLEWSTDLAKEAEDYAQQLARTGKLEHDPNIGSEGENLFVSSGDATFEDAVDAWLNEEKNYDGEVIGKGNMDDWHHFSGLILPLYCFDER